MQIVAVQQFFHGVSVVFYDIMSRKLGGLSGPLAWMGLNINYSQRTEGYGDGREKSQPRNGKWLDVC
jgi:hypothetical protein